MKYWILLPTVVSTFIIFSCHANTNDESKQLITDIVHKICNISMSSMRKSSGSQTVETLAKLESKLRQVSQKLGSDNENYVKVIIQGIEEMTLKNNYKICYEYGFPALKSEFEILNHDIINHVHNITHNNNNNTTTTVATSIPVATNESQGKHSLLKQMLIKLDTLSKKAFKNITTIEGQNRVLENLKKRIGDALRRRNIDNDEKNGTFTDIIVEGLQMMIKNNETRRMAHEIVATGTENHESTTPVYGVTTPMSCGVRYSAVCASIEKINEFVCSYDDTILTLDKICDGSIDCPDGSDEKNCARQAVAKVHKATEIMTEIHMASSCFPTLTENVMVSRHGKLLISLLQEEIDFINRHATEKVPFDITNEQKGQYGKIVEKDVTLEVSTLLKSFVMTLHSTLCNKNGDEQFVKIFNRNNEIVDQEIDQLLEPNWPLRLCSCEGKFCANSSCITSCKRICFQRFTLERWSCQATSGEASVPLSQVCDGKLDCIDETDEFECSFGTGPSKFEATQIFEAILKSIKSKIGTFEYRPAHKKLIGLYESIKILQIRSMKSKINPTIYKEHRDKCFETLVSIYDDILNTISSLTHKEEEVYEFLLIINDKLITALKKSQTGNSLVISPDGCFCRWTACAMPRCSKKCARTCAAKPLLTKYACGTSNSSDNNSYVPIEFICNGKANCPNGEDEKHCSKDLCRSHHLVVLRHHLQKVGEKHEGTVLGEALKTWKGKVIGTLMEAEKTDRPTPLGIKVVVSKILQDLVITYVGLDEYRRVNNQVILQKFEKLSQRIMETLKGCGM